MELRWMDERTAKVADNPKVTVQFAETEDAHLIDKVLGNYLFNCERKCDKIER